MDEVATRQIQVIVTKRGKPVAKLVPVQAEPPNPIGFMRGTVLKHGDIVSPDFEAWAESPSDPLK